MNEEILQKYITSILSMLIEKATFLAERFELVEFTKDELLSKVKNEYCD